MKLLFQKKLFLFKLFLGLDPSAILKSTLQFPTPLQRYQIWTGR